MPPRAPSWLARYCKQILPPLFDRVDGERILRLVQAIVDTDRWNSFDRFHDTAQTMVAEYEAAGAVPSVHRAQTGVGIGSGRWIVPEASDVVSATLDVVKPVRRRVVDYAKNPFQVVHWSASTPPAGITTELVVVDTEDELKRLGRKQLLGKLALTTTNLYRKTRQWADKGAVGVVVETNVKASPDATGWSKFGWGGLQVDDAAVRILGFAVSKTVGQELRQLVKKHGAIRVKACVNIRNYVGAHDVVSGLVVGQADPQDEVWAIAHSFEPGAADNASGVAVCIEIARVINALAEDGALPRPKRSIRLLNGHECYGFFHYLENTSRFQTPLAGACIDCVGIEPELCDRRLDWHATVPSSAGFVDRLGEGIIRAALRIDNPGYRCGLQPFVSTADTLIGDPKYGFPCPWLATYRNSLPGYDAYHSSADTVDVLSPRGLAVCAASMAAYLYWLADADTADVAAVATWETDRELDALAASPAKLSAADAEFKRTRHHANIERLKRWLWGGERAEILSHLDSCERRVRDTLAGRTQPKPKQRKPRGAGRVPMRKAPITPCRDNTPQAVMQRIIDSKLPAWTLFWADGQRSLADIADMASCETGKDVAVEQVAKFFDAHADLGYVQLIEPRDLVFKAQLLRGLRALGVERGMDLMVHSSLSSIGHVAGGADAVVDALLAVIGKPGTLVVPSFNHNSADVFNPLATRTINGAIPDALWRRPDAVRSLHASHAVAAIGPNAEAICAGHLETGVWEQDSPIGRLIHCGGYILSIGDIGEPRTAYHVAENSMPCGCIDPFGSTCRIVDADGEVRRVRGLAWRGGICPVPPDKMNELLDKRSLQRRGKIGHAGATLVKAKDLWDVRREQLKRACPKCKIKPRPYKRRRPR